MDMSIRSAILSQKTMMYTTIFHSSWSLEGAWGGAREYASDGAPEAARECVSDSALEDAWVGSSEGVSVSALFW